MTLLELDDSELPHLAPFLNAICPGQPGLDDNMHFKLGDDFFPDGMIGIHWPITDPSSSICAQLQRSYLNIARPPMSRHSNESTTYVSVPLHVTNAFRVAIERNHKVNEGNYHIGANVNSLAQDPFKEVLSNPGCLTQVLDIGVSNTHSARNSGTSSSHARQASGNWLKMKKPGNRTSEMPGPSHSVFDLCFDGVIDKILNHSKDSYSTTLTASSKLLVASHVNVLNILGIKSGSCLSGTVETVVDKPILPFVPCPNHDPKAAQDPKLKREYCKVVETPLLRIQWNKSLVITCTKSILSASMEPYVMLGFDTGMIAILNLKTLMLQLIFDFDEGRHSPQSHSKGTPFPQVTHSLIPLFVSSIETIEHPDYNFLVVAGFSNGEVAIIDPSPESQPSHHHHLSDILHTSLFLAHSTREPSPYVKSVVAVDASATYYKKFDLTQWAHKDGRNLQRLNSQDSAYPPHLVGHFKVSHKPITSIASTASRSNAEQPHNGHRHHTHSLRPCMVAIGSGDGLVRLIDLNQTLNGNYGVSPLESKSEGHLSGRSIVSDTIPNYFNDNVTSLCFSRDHRFLCVAGSGDMIEVYRITYSNIDHILHRAPRVPVGKRSQSGTINSFVSEPQTARSRPPSDHLSLQLDSGAYSRLSNYAQQIKGSLPPFVKDIKIATRLKGHLNVVSSVLFVDSVDTESNSSLIYNLISCGQDGKILVWEFDYKVLPRLKPYTLNSRSRGGDDGLLSLVKTVSLDASRRTRPLFSSLNATRMSASHSRSRSMASMDHSPSPVFPSGFGVPSSGNGAVTNILEILQTRPTNDSLGSQSVEATEDFKIEFLDSLYKDSFNLRLKRHHKTSASLQKALASNIYTIFHPVVDDKLVPSILIPILEISLVKFVGSNPVTGVYTDSEKLWCFSKSGDIFTFGV